MKTSRNTAWDEKRTPSKRTTGTIVKNFKGRRYLLTSRRLIEMDSYDAGIGEPWYATNKNLRKAALHLPYGGIEVTSKTPNATEGQVTVSAPFGKVTLGIANIFPDRAGLYRVGCAFFDFKTFKRILRNAGVKGTQKKAFAAKAGA
jgi:hypothetical protein